MSCERVDWGKEYIADTAKILHKLRSIIADELAKNNCRARVYLFGSWARGEQRHSSDINIAIEQKDAIDTVMLANLRDRLEESDIPYRVDVVDLAAASVSIVQKIKQEGILWQDW